MTAGQQRKVQRLVHLAAGLVLITYLYAPLDAQLEDAARFLVLPVLVLTGMAMWQAPRIRRLRKSPVPNRERSAREVDKPESDGKSEREPGRLRVVETIRVVESEELRDRELAAAVRLLRRAYELRESGEDVPRQS